MEISHMPISSGHGKYFSFYPEHDWGFSMLNDIYDKPCLYSIFKSQQATNKDKIMKETVKIVLLSQEHGQCAKPERWSLVWHLTALM